MQDSILRFSRPENLKNNIFATLGQGQGLRAGQGRAQGRGAGTGRRGRAQRAKQGSKIHREARPENPKITVLQLFEVKGKGQQGRACVARLSSEFRGFRVYGLRSYRLIRRSLGVTV